MGVWCAGLIVFLPIIIAAIVCAIFKIPFPKG